MKIIDSNKIDMVIRENKKQALIALKEVVNNFVGNYKNPEYKSNVKTCWINFGSYITQIICHSDVSEEQGVHFINALNKYVNIMYVFNNIIYNNT